ncbi:MAG TPA: hypothetical protein VKA19_00680 [Alphaproteobacteria bacterium]|nr:hypothetical protein [Alphaproteobacteria bacterium]
MRRLTTAFGIAIAMLWTANAANAAILSSITLNTAGSLSASGGNSYTSLPTPGTFEDIADLYLVGAPNFSLGITASSSLNGVKGFSDIAVQLFDPSDSLVASGTLSSSGNVYFSRIENFLALGTNVNPYEIHITGTNENGGSYQFSVGASVVPIPGAALLFGSGLAALGFAGRFNRRKVKAEDEVAA